MATYNQVFFTITNGSWRELLGRKHLGALIVLCSGVALYAIDSYVTASLLSKAIEQLGGDAYYVCDYYFLIAAISVMWGVGTLVGPLLGGIFVRVGYWQGAFWFLAIVMGLIALLFRSFWTSSEFSRERYCTFSENAFLFLCGNSYTRSTCHSEESIITYNSVQQLSSHTSARFSG